MTTPDEVPVQPLVPFPNGAELLADLVSWFGRFVRTVSDWDHDLMALWTVHTHLAPECYTTPRLQIDSIMPGSGKTTTLEHLARLCRDAVSMASISSPALLVRLLDNGPRTILIDEADRSLDPDKPGIGDLLAVLNSGYKRGATRPVLVQVKGGNWEPREMPTFAPVAMAGNNPRLPDDTRSRIIRVLLLPDLDGLAEESDWELIEGDAAELAGRITAWADAIREPIKTCRPAMPEKITGRFREKWQPLARIAEMAGGRWPQSVAAMAIQDREQFDMDKEDGLVRDKPAIVLLRNLFDVWPQDAAFAPSTELVARLIGTYPQTWGSASSYGKDLTYQRLGRMLASDCKINSSREGNYGPRGYYRTALEAVWSRMQIGTRPNQTDGTGSTGSSGSELAGSAGSAGPAGSIQPPLPEPAPDAATCQTCGRASAFSLIHGKCRKCAMDGAR